MRMHSQALLTVLLKKTRTTRLVISRVVLALALALALLSGALPAGTQQASFPELSPQLEPLRSRFNADADKVRLVLLLDPT